MNPPESHDHIIVKRSVVVSGHRTSVSLEAAYWKALKDCAREKGKSINALISDIDRTRAGSLSSALRRHLLEWARG